MSIKEKASQAMREIKEEGKVLKGEKTKDKTYASTREFSDELSAKEQLPSAKERLFNVNAWTHIPGIANAGFELHNREGEPLKKTRVAIDDFIKIDLPGPLPMYWVKVTELSEEEDSAQFTVQPTYDPTDRSDDKTVTDHFFQDQARSIFRVERNGNAIIAQEIGLNEAINNEETEAGEKRLINTLVSETGWAGFQKYQWKNLTDYLVGIRTPTK